jgi:hypothetical protein
VYDAKTCEKHFSVGTSDREMYKYFNRKGEELKKRRVNRSYFLIVSSGLVKGVFRRTRIPIIIMSAADLLFLIEENLKDTDLTHERFEQLFLETAS